MRKIRKDNGFVYTNEAPPENILDAREVISDLKARMVLARHKLSEYPWQGIDARNLISEVQNLLEFNTTDHD